VKLERSIGLVSAVTDNDISISKLRFMDMILIDLLVKNNGTYYCSVLLTQKLLSVIREISGEFVIIQQDKTPAH